MEAGITLGWRVFTFNQKTKAKRILGKKGMLQIWGSGFVKYKLKGLSEYCLNQASQFLDENDTLYSWEIHKEKMMLGCLFLASSLQGQQNSNTPAPYSTLFSFYLTFLIFDIGVNKYTRKANPLDMWVANRVWAHVISIYFKLDAASTKLTRNVSHSCPFSDHPHLLVTLISSIW